MFEPNKINAFRFQFLPHKQDVGKDLEVTSISLELGNRDVRVLVMHWKGDCKNALTYENNTIAGFSMLSSPFLGNKSKPDSKSDLNWNEIQILSNTRLSLLLIDF